MFTKVSRFTAPGFRYQLTLFSNFLSVVSETHIGISLFSRNILTFLVIGSSWAFSSFAAWIFTHIALHVRFSHHRTFYLCIDGNFRGKNKYMSCSYHAMPCLSLLFSWSFMFKLDINITSRLFSIFILDSPSTLSLAANTILWAQLAIVWFPLIQCPRSLVILNAMPVMHW